MHPFSPFFPLIFFLQKSSCRPLHSFVRDESREDETASASTKTGDGSVTSLTGQTFENKDENTNVDGDFYLSSQQNRHNSKREVLSETTRHHFDPLFEQFLLNVVNFSKDECQLSDEPLPTRVTVVVEEKKNRKDQKVLPKPVVKGLFVVPNLFQ